MSGSRIAVIGAGVIGAPHISVLAADQQAFALAAIADPMPKAADMARPPAHRISPTTTRCLTRSGQTAW
ncbi:Gfo/Idh/MocA family oxidoreductase [Polaromonas sp. P1(28)-13]|nr:Gfo/Idh/MocA family oxidoreductase [Polaromonas sp. P1(28)-13]